MIKLKTLPLAAIVFAAVFGGIGVSAALGLWKTENTKEPAKIRAGEFQGLPSPSDIRGSYTWDEVSKAFGVPAPSLLAAFGADSGAAKVNTLEALYGGKLPAGQEIGTDSVRLFVALYTGLPHDPEADTILPATAVDVLRAEGKAERTRLDAAAVRAFGAAPAASVAPAAPAVKPAAAPAAPPAPASAPNAPAASAASGTEHVQAAGTITGKTTFGDLEAWKYDMAKVEALLGGLGAKGEALKDWCAAKGLSFSEIKTKLQELAPK